MDFQKLILILCIILAGFTLVYFLMKQLCRQFLRSIRSLGEHLIDKLFRGLSNLEVKDQEQPKSLPSMENLILPQVLKDYPDFDLAMAKNAVMDHLNSLYGKRPLFQVHNVVLAEYRKGSVKRTLVFYAAVCWKTSRLEQKKLAVSMEYQCVEGKHNPALNCPNCGATLGFHDLECKYCGTRINDRRDQEWSFPSVREIY